MIGAEFRAIRLQLGMTQRELADAFDISERSVRTIETSTQVVRHVYALAIRQLASNRNATGGDRE